MFRGLFGGRGAVPPAEADPGAASVEGREDEVEGRGGDAEAPPAGPSEAASDAPNDAAEGNAGEGDGGAEGGGRAAGTPAADPVAGADADRRSTSSGPSRASESSRAPSAAPSQPPSVAPSSRASATFRASASLPRPSGSAVPLSALAPGDLFIRLAAERIAGMREARKVPALLDDCRRALAVLDSPPSHGHRRVPSTSSLSSHQGPVSGSGRTPDELAALYAPLAAACGSRNTALASVAVDCFGKLFAYDYWGRGAADGGDPGRASIDDLDDAAPPVPDAPSGPSQRSANYPDMVVDAVSACFTTPLPPPAMQLQIVKALSAAVSSPGGVHGSTLLKCIRTLYNVFLLSAEAEVQVVAQGGLSQCVAIVVGRVPKEGFDFGDYEPPLEPAPATDAPDGASSPPRSPHAEHPQHAPREPLAVTHLKDTFLLLRALLKLAMKPLPPGDPDLRSHPMRSKLLSLSLVQSVLQASPHVLATDAWPLFARGGGEDRTMVQAVKQYLCVGLARNLASAVPQVYDASLDIFVRVAASSVRGSLKKELSVLFTELLLPILESKPPTSVTYHQRLSLLRHLGRLLSSPEGPRLLVEIYLNYDCDPEASGRENVWERMVSALARVVNRTESGAAGTPTSSTPTDKRPPGSGEQAFISTQHLAQLSKTEVSQLYSSKGDAAELRRRALEVLVTGVLGGLAEWVRSRRAEEDAREAESGGPGTPRAGAEDDEEPAAGQPPAADVPSVFEQSMRRKMLAQEGVRRFNWKPKKGVGMLLETGMVPSSDPKEIARFLLRAEGVDKRVLGEYLGEGDEEHIAIMHAFVDGMEFAGMRFVDALREFLQSFRLPGEAQKIDRFMLKFAERYLANNPGKFGSADTAYVLAYSVVMLNTDLHNPQIKKHMTKQEFIRNNRGIDEGKDLDQDFLETIYDEIASNEIRMKEEHENKPAAPEPPALGLDLLSLVPVARKRAPAPSLASEQMAQKTEGVLFKLLRGRKKKAAAVLAESASRNSIEAVGDRAGVSNVWFRASHHEHVRGMFEVVWMPVLTAVSGPLQETEDPDQLQLCLEGLRLSIRLSCEFPEMELERRAFVSTLSRFTQLANLGEIRPKNIEAIKLLLEIALAEGNFLGESWRDVAACISQLDRLALLGGGGAGDEGIKRIMSRSSISAGSGDAKAGKAVLEKAALETATPDMTVAIDRIFSGSVQLSGSAINDFYRALCAVSWDEIQSSSSWEHPRMYSLQRLVEMSYYNMNRIRMEWTNLWAILGDHLNQVGCHPNPNVGFFAIDKLHQLAMKFMDLDELPYFKFQKDFLRPYDYILGNNPDQGIKDMVLRCIHQLIQSKSRNMKSGWRTVFSALSRAGRDKSESVVNYSFEIVRALHTSFFDTVVANQAAPELINSLVEFCKNPRYEKISLQATEILKATVPRIADIAVAESARVRRIWEEEQAAGGEAETATATKQRKEDPMLKYWFPILFGLYEIVMTCELEVRTRALNYLFETLREYGGTFQQDFWEVVCRGVLFPIFDDLRMSKSETTKFGNREDMSIWLSTTLIKALHEFVALFDVFYEPLSFMMDGLLDLLALCVTQENEALARIGAGCIQQFVETNAAKFDAEAWDKVCGAFGRLFQATTPAGLFQLREQAMTFAPGLPLDRNIREEEGSKGLEQQSLKPGQSTSEQQQPDTPPESPEDLPVGGTGPASTQERPPISKKEFQQTISKCVIQLLLIQTLHETLTRNPVVYGNIPTASYLALLDCFERSFQFAKRFNNDLELRLALYRAGYMQQLPNLLKQETTAASCYAAGLLKIFVDSGRGAAMQAMVEQRVAPLASDIFEQFNGFDPETKKRNIAAWKPVIVMFLNSIALFDDEQFARHIPVFYTLFVNTLLRDITPDIRQALHAVLLRVGDYIFGKE